MGYYPCVKKLKENGNFEKYFPFIKSLKKKRRYMSNLLLTPLAIIIVAGCAKKAVPSPETVIISADSTITVESISVPAKIEESAIEISILEPEFIETTVEEIVEEECPEPIIKDESEDKKTEDEEPVEEQIDS